MQTLWMLMGTSATVLVSIVMTDVPLFGQAGGIPGSEAEALFKYVFGGGAVTILGALAFYLAVYVLPRAQEKHEDHITVIEDRHREAIKVLGEKHETVIKTITDRFDGWEQTRHNDANLLNTTLRDMTSHCARYRAPE